MSNRGISDGAAAAPAVLHDPAGAAADHVSSMIVRMSRPPHELDPKFVAGVKLIERTGAQSYRVGYSHEDDGEPVVWYATATWGIDPSTGRPLPKGGRIRHEAAGGLDAVTATLRLCEQVIDGGTCAHCGRLTIFVADAGEQGPLPEMGCVYAWDPELATFRRSCEGET